MRKTILAAAAVCVIFASLPVLGAGGGGGGAGGGGGETARATEPDFSQGVAAVEARNWPQVVARMGSVVARDPNNADAWNYMGYAYRQMGEMDKSFKHYETALQLNPRHRGAHEYLGEAYLQVGKLAQAEEQLKILDKLCFLPCDEYGDLRSTSPGTSKSTSQALRGDALASAPRALPDASGLGVPERVIATATRHDRLSQVTQALETNASMGG